MKEKLLYIVTLLSVVTAGLGAYMMEFKTVEFSKVYLYQYLLLTASSFVVVRSIRKDNVKSIKYIIPLTTVGQFLALYQCITVEPEKWEWFQQIPLPIVTLTLLLSMSTLSIFITKESK